MLNDKKELHELIAALIALFKAEKRGDIEELLQTSEITGEETDYNGWNGGVYYYSIYFTASVDAFLKVQKQLEEVEYSIKEKIELILRSHGNIRIANIFIIPKSMPKIEWDKIANLFSKDQLIVEINFIKDTMISVSTGGQQIQNVNDQYQKRFSNVAVALGKLGLENPNSYSDLWQWFGRWKVDELKTYQ